MRTLLILIAFAAQFSWGELPACRQVGNLPREEWQVGNLPHVAQERPLAPMPHPAPLPGEKMIEDYFKAQVKEIAGKCLTDLTTKEAWEKKRPELRKQFLEMVGLHPLPERTDLKATVTGTVEGDGFTVEKLHFQSAPGLYVTANFYLPKGPKTPPAHAPGATRKYPTILYVCGHGNVVEDKVSYGSKVFYQYHPAWFAKNGYACLILDTLQLGEVPGEHHGTYKLGQWWWQTRGYTPAGIELWNAMRALDYLETRPEVDAKKIGVTGRSGGGATSWWILAADDRPICFAPIAGMVDLQSQLCEGGVGERLKKGVIAGHCDCMFLVNKYRWDFPMVAALAAPRPLLLGNSDEDEIFPVPGYRRLAEKVSKVYALYGKEGADKFQLLETKGPHKDTPELRRGINAWMNRWLKGQAALPIDDELPAKLKPQDLKVFAKLPTDSINATIQETWIKPAMIELPKTAEEAKKWWPEKQKELMKQLETECFAGWPKDSSEDEGPPCAGFGMSFGNYRRSTLNFMGRGKEQHTLNVAENNTVKVTGITLYLLNESSKEYDDPPDGEIWASCEIRGKSKDTHILRRFALIGQTADAQRVWNIRQAIQTLRLHHGQKMPIRIHAKGELAGIALYAALFEPNIEELVLEDLPTSFREGPIFLNVAKVLDMPQAVALAASKVKSVHLKVKTEKEKAAWEWPAELQRLTGEKSLRVTVTEK